MFTLANMQCLNLEPLTSSSPFLRSAGIWSQRVSHGEQGFYLHQRPRLDVHGCLRSGQRYFEELAHRP